MLSRKLNRSSRKRIFRKRGCNRSAVADLEKRNVIAIFALYSRRTRGKTNTWNRKNHALEVESFLIRGRITAALTVKCLYQTKFNSISHGIVYIFSLIRMGTAHYALPFFLYVHKESLVQGPLLRLVRIRHSTRFVVYCVDTQLPQHAMQCNWPEPGC